MAMRAYKVQDIVVFASRGTEAKLLAAPKIRPDEEWREDVAAWVALRAERAPELDDQVDPAQSTPYIFQP
ncbi:MAG: hypothetical protein CSH37_08495 [Thalassolituus sp.]|jgi:hypothetical protein|uniref:Uncharacterized protein n=1 Tax=Thalassolituus maritimus TaxID=484498 RepID=A0ABP9ZZG8_9GAMM|nr:hypothetical protein [Pseudomonadota bacterium]MEC8523104.1 hypothetical protein [Pseudomonadota bacterium]TNC85216.1 MAG: hypothetical protein CSH37_08495 [Thalassolituus sp.]